MDIVHKETSKIANIFKIYILFALKEQVHTLMIFHYPYTCLSKFASIQKINLILFLPM